MPNIAQQRLNRINLCFFSFRQGVLHGIENHQECGKVQRSSQIGDKCFGENFPTWSQLRTVSAIIASIVELEILITFAFFLLQFVRKNVGLVWLPRTHVHCVRNAWAQCFWFSGEFSISIGVLHGILTNYSSFFWNSARTTTSLTRWTTYAIWRINCVIQLNFYMTIVSLTQTWNLKIFYLLTLNTLQATITKR